MTRLFIENYEVDLAQGLSQQLTYAIDDLQNLDSKATAFSRTIVLPGTTKNNSLLGNIFDFNNSNLTNDSEANINYNFNAARVARCVLITNGYQVIKGVFRLLEIIVDGQAVEYEGAIFGELGGFIAALGNNRLQDLDFSAYDETWTASNITASWDTINGTGVYYPLIDYGNVSTNKSDFQYKAFRPALYVYEYMDKIITGAGYTWESTFFNTNFFKRLIIPSNTKALYKQVNQLITASQNASLGEILTNPDFQNEINFDVTSLSNFTAVGNTFRYDGANTTTLQIAINFQGNYYSIGEQITFEFRKNGTTVASTAFPATFDMVSQPFQWLETVNVTLATNDVISFTVSIAYNDVGQYQVVSESFQFTATNNTAQQVEAALNDTIAMNYVIPKGIFQKDFFASILKMFNLYVTEDTFNEKHLKIEPYVDFYAGDVVDWSYKLDRSKQIRLKPMSEINARYYQFKYKQDADFYAEDYRKKYNEGYGDRIFDNGFDFAKDTETLEVIFSSSVLFGAGGDDKVFPAIYKKSNNQAAEDSFDHNIRIMQAKKITGVNSWDMLNGVTVLTSPTSYGYAGHLDDPDAPASDINFGATQELYFALGSGDLTANLFNAYYSSYMAEITDKDSRTLTGMFYLKDEDIFNLDFAKFVYIDGGYYRISKISDFVPGGNELTKVELLRVINTTY